MAAVAGIPLLVVLSPSAVENVRFRAGRLGSITHGATDDYCYNIAQDTVHAHDLHATILHCLGIDHTKLTFKLQDRHFRLTEVHGKVVKPVLA